ncbi:MAG: tetratricopeptide repeat protein [Phycisphaerae bacterium]
MSRKTAAPTTVVLLALLLTGGCQTSQGPSPADTRLATELYVRSQLLAEGGDLDAALEELRQAVKADPTLSIAHTSMGNIYQKRKEHHMARVAYENAVSANPFAFTPAYNLGVTYQALARAAQTAAEAKRYVSKAVETYLRAVTLKPKDYDAHLNLSACYFDLGNASMAEQYCRKAIQLEPGRKEAHKNLAVIQHSQGKVYEAVEAYNKALEFDIHQPDILLALGGIYAQQGRTREAIRVFLAAAEEVPADPTPWVQIGAAYFAQQQYDKALEAYDKALEIDSNSAAAWRGRGYTFMTQFLQDPEQLDLRTNALDSWNRSLDLHADQPRLRQLVRKYTPRRNLPEL